MSGTDKYIQDLKCCGTIWNKKDGRRSDEKREVLYMSDREKPFEVTKTFGLGVLLKLTKKNVNGIEISSNGEKFTSNVNLDTLSNAVHATIEAHNINLKIE